MTRLGRCGSGAAGGWWVWPASTPAVGSRWRWWAKGDSRVNRVQQLTAQLALLALAAGPAAGRAAADSDCSFDVAGARHVLRADCSTDATLHFPDGARVDGGGHTITARDPRGGRFEGAVVQNAGSSLHVRDLRVSADLSGGCAPAAPEDLRLRGILLLGASGSVVDSEVVDLRRPGSGCQEGFSIEARNASDAPVRTVRIAGNSVSGYQKVGVLVVGAVDARIALNRIVGLGPVAKLAQNGIQLSGGAVGSVRWNVVAGAQYTGSGAASAGVLLSGAGDGVDVSMNRIVDCDVGIYVVSSSAAGIVSNRTARSTYVGVVIDGRGGDSVGSRISGHVSQDDLVGIAVLGPGARDNTIAHARLRDSGAYGVQLSTGAARTRVVQNRIVDTGVDGIYVGGSDQSVRANVVLRAVEVGIRVAEGEHDIARNRVRGSGLVDIAWP